MMRVRKMVGRREQMKGRRGGVVVGEGWVEELAGMRGRGVGRLVMLRGLVGGVGEGGWGGLWMRRWRRRVRVRMKGRRGRRRRRKLRVLKRGRRRWLKPRPPLLFRRRKRRSTLLNPNLMSALPHPITHLPPPTLTPQTANPLFRLD